MKKIFKLMSACIMMVVCLISASGCSCSKPMNVYYTINQSNENKDTKEKAKLEIKNILDLKYREPVDTPCYKKVGEKYEIIEDSREIYECYTADGKYFEKATYNRKEKENLEEEYVIWPHQKEVTAYTSSKTEVPENENYSLIYQFIIKNKEDSTIYIKEITVNDILNKQIKNEEKSLNKVKITLPKEKEVLDNKAYYRIDSNQEMKIIIEVKGLTTKDSAVKKSKDLNLILNLIVRK